MGEMSRRRSHICPSCLGRSVVRDIVRQRWSRRCRDAIIAAVAGRRPYLCRDCGRRFYDRPTRHTVSA